MARVIWAHEALWNLESLGEYLNEVAPDQTARVLSTIVDATEDLASFPRMGRVVPERGEPSLRELIVGRYRVFYEIADDTVTVMMVLDAARDAEARLRFLLGGL